MLFYTYKNFLDFSAAAIRIDAFHPLAPLQKRNLSFEECLIPQGDLSVNCFSLN